MKTLSEIKFGRVIKEGFHDLLKPLGFKKKANNFYLQHDGIGQIINIQKSSWGTRDCISFTINTGLFLPEYWMGLTYNQGKEIPTFPTEAECIIRKRVGELRNQGDTWYDISEKTDENKLISEMQINLENYILPYFNRTKTKEDLLNLLDSEELIWAPLGKLVVYGELKHFNKARIEYLTILKEKTNPHFLETAKEYGIKYRLE